MQIFNQADALRYYQAITWAQKYATTADDTDGTKEHALPLEELRAHFLEIALAESSVLSPDDESNFIHRKITEYVGIQNE
mgnify:CR=1 FL=1